MSNVIDFHAVHAVLSQHPRRARCLYVQQGRRDARASELIALARDAGVRFDSRPAAWFKRRAEGATPQGLVLDCHALALAAAGLSHNIYETPRLGGNSG